MRPVHTLIATRYDDETPWLSTLSIPGDSGRDVDR